MSKDLLVSVIIPVYKVEPYLDRCLNTIVNQTYKNLEIILVDDGSPDNCPQMCDDWAKKDKRIKVVHKKNGGLSDARNAGMNVCSGEYISFIDSDDWVEITYIEKLLKKIQEKNSDYAICRFKKTDEKNELFVYERNLKDGITPQELLKCYLLFNEQYSGDIVETDNIMACAWRTLYKRDCIINHRYTLNIVNEDIVFNVDALKNINKIAVVDEYLHCYFTNFDSLSRSFSEKYYLDFKNLMNFMRDKLKGRVDDKFYFGYMFYLYKAIVIKAIYCQDKTLRKKVFKDKEIAKFNNYKNYKNLNKVTKNIKRKFSNFLIKIKFFKLYKLLNRGK